MIEELFADLLKRHSLNEIYEMDILELLRLINRDSKKKTTVKESDSFFDLL